jgi:flagellar hook-associated protein 2
MNTSQIIQDLMKLEAAPQNALKTKVSVAQSTVAAYQSVNMRFATLKTNADNLAKAETWQALTVASTSSSVSASASAAAVSGSMTFNVQNTSVAHVRVSDKSAPIAGLTATVADKAVGLDVSIHGGAAVHIDLTDDSLSGVVAAINAKKDLGVTAAAVQVSPGNYVLQLSSAKTGSASDFTVTGISGTDFTAASSILATGADARITVGSGAAAYDVVSSTNTFSDVLPGVTFTVSKAETAVTLTTSRNTGSMADKMQALVDAANAAMTEMGRQGAFVPAGKSGALAGDYTLRMLDDKLGNAVATELTDGKSLVSIGVSLDKTGKYTFDREKFTAALVTSSATTQAYATEFAARVTTIADAATKPDTGSLTQAMDSQNSAITDLTKRISDWDRRLGIRQDALKRQFGAMEVALGKMQSQGSWLAGQLGSLPSWNTN